MYFCLEGQVAAPTPFPSKGSNDTLTSAAGCIITEFEIPLFHSALSLSCNFYRTRNDRLALVKKSFESNAILRNGIPNSLWRGPIASRNNRYKLSRGRVDRASPPFDHSSLVAEPVFRAAVIHPLALWRCYIFYSALFIRQPCITRRGIEFLATVLPLRFDQLHQRVRFCSSKRRILEEVWEFRRFDRDLWVDYGVLGIWGKFRDTNTRREYGNMKEYIWNTESRTNLIFFRLLLVW